MSSKLDCDGKCSFLSFKLDKNIFAISVQKVLEVLEKQEITLVPNSPDYIAGVLNFRGEILTIIDLRRKFRLQNINDNKFVIIVLELMLGDKKILSGAIVDRVVDVLTIEPNDVKKAPEMGSHFKVDFILGLIKNNDDIVTILNIDNVFDKHDLEMVKEVEEKTQ